MSNRTAKKVDLGALDAAIGTQGELETADASSERELAEGLRAPVLPDAEEAAETEIGVERLQKLQTVKALRVDFLHSVVFPDAKGSAISLTTADTADQQRKMPPAERLRFGADGLNVTVEREGRTVEYFYPWTSIKSVQRVLVDGRA